MSKSSRRSFCVSAASAAALAACPGVFAEAKATTFAVDATKAGPPVPADFIGLSYETAQLSDPTYFAPDNAPLIAAFRAIGERGVLRLGGNTSDVGWWKPTPASTQPPLPANVVVVPLHAGQRPFQELAYAVTPLAVTNLRAFLDATGWTCLYGINLGTSTPSRAAEEATFVARTLGPKLDYFQLGNEPDLFPSRFRDRATWTAETYFNLWYAAADAIRKAVPGARFGLPDTSGNPAWYAVVASRLIALPAAERPHVAALTHHYYIGGPPTNPQMTVDYILQAKPRVMELAVDVITAASRLAAATHVDVPWRMSEGNTCYQGGKPGVSDVFAAALWAADYCLLLASLGYSGVNLHGGSRKQVGNSLGGALPGEAMLGAAELPHPKPFYTPIADIEGHLVLEPVAYGMRFAGHFAGMRMMPVRFAAGTAMTLVNVTAYAGVRPTGQRVLAIVNKDTAHDLHIDVPGYTAALVLSAPSVTARTAMLSEPAGFREMSVVPRASAVLLESPKPELPGQVPASPGGDRCNRRPCLPQLH